MAAGAVNTPLELIEPALAVQVTDCDGLFVPFTTAENVADPVAVPGETTTEVTVGVAVAARVTVAVPVFVVSNVLRAVIVIVWTEDVLAGAVNTPELLIDPAEAVHVTPCDGELVPATTAEKVVDPVAVEGDTVTLVTVGVTGSAVASVVDISVSTEAGIANVPLSSSGAAPLMFPPLR